MSAHCGEARDAPQVYITVQVNPVLKRSSVSGVESKTCLPTLSRGWGQPVA